MAAISVLTHKQYYNLYYIKGKYMILNDFLSRQKVDDSNPCEIIPISFSLRTVL